MTAPPTLSVVFKNYNHGHLLRRSLSALSAQTDSADEWILIDDASQDNSREILEDWIRGRENCTLICREVNEGVISSLNEGLRRARGDYVYFAAADDVTLPDLFAKLLTAAAAHPGVGLCLADFFLFNDDTGWRRRHHVSQKNRAAFLRGPDFGRLLLSGAPFHYPPSGVIVHRESLLAVGGFNAKAGWLTDWWTNLQVGLQHGVCFVPEALAGFRADPASFSGAGTKKAPEVAALWSLAATYKAGGDRESLWLSAAMAVPEPGRRLMWRELYRHPECWTWIARHGWNQRVWPTIRPWLWPAAQVIRWVAPNSIHVSALRFFGATLAPGVRLARSVNVDRPWRLRVDEGAIIESGVKIGARASVFIGAHASIGCGSQIDSSMSNPDLPGPDAVIIGAHASIGERAVIFSGAEIAANSSVGAHTLMSAADSPGPSRQLLEEILALPRNEMG